MDGTASVEWRKYISRQELKLYFHTSSLHQITDFIWPCAWCWRLLKKKERSWVLWTIESSKPLQSQCTHCRTASIPLHMKTFKTSWKAFLANVISYLHTAMHHILLNHGNIMENTIYSISIFHKQERVIMVNRWQFRMEIRYSIYRYFVVHISSKRMRHNSRSTLSPLNLLNRTVNPDTIVIVIYDNTDRHCDLFYWTIQQINRTENQNTEST